MEATHLVTHRKQLIVNSLQRQNLFSKYISAWFKVSHILDSLSLDEQTRKTEIKYKVHDNIRRKLHGTKTCKSEMWCEKHRVAKEMSVAAHKSL